MLGQGRLYTTVVKFALVSYGVPTCLMLAVMNALVLDYGQSWIVDRHKRFALYKIEKCSNPKTTKGEKGYEIEPVDVKSFGVKRGLDDPEDIDQSHHKQTKSYRPNNACAPLVAP